MRTLGVFDRIVLAVYTVGLIVVAFVLLGLAGGWSGPLVWLRTSMASQGGRALMALVGVLFLLTSARLLAVVFGGGGAHSVVHDLPLGKVRVSVGAIEGLVVRLVRGVPGVREAKASVRVKDDLLQVRIRAVVGPEVPIGELAEELQQSVRNQVRQVVGVGVDKVVVEVTNITPQTRKARVE